MSAPIPPPREWPSLEEAHASSRFWAAVMLTTNVEVCVSIVRGLPVLARQLDAEALRRALRGLPFPPPDEYVRVDVDMLDAVAEGGPFDHLKGRPR